MGEGRRNKLSWVLGVWSDGIMYSLGFGWCGWWICLLSLVVFNRLLFVFLCFFDCVSGNFLSVQITSRFVPVSPVLLLS